MLYYKTSIRVHESMFNLFTDSDDALGWDDYMRKGAVFFISTNGGKDSQCMYIDLCKKIPHEQIVLVHADLGIVEWAGVQEHIRNKTRHELHVVQAKKTFLDMVEMRYKKRPDVPSWPSASYRQCTSDLKRGPIEKFIRHYMKARGLTMAVNCMGLGASESAARAKKRGVHDQQISIQSRAYSSELAADT